MPVVRGGEKGGVMDAKVICNRIRWFREKAGLSRSAFALALGVKESRLSRLEAGQFLPSLRTLFRVSAVLKIRVRDLCDPD